MNPSPAAVTAIQARVAQIAGGWSNTDAQLVAALNAATMPNPSAQPQIPNAISESALIPLLNDPANGSVAKLLNWVNFGLVKADIDSGNRAGMLMWPQRLQLLGIITAGEASNITSYLNGATPDANWQSLVSWSQLNLGRAADDDDVAKARP